MCSENWDRWIKFRVRWTSLLNEIWGSASEECGKLGVHKKKKLITNLKCRDREMRVNELYRKSKNPGWLGYEWGGHGRRRDCLVVYATCVLVHWHHDPSIPVCTPAFPTGSFLISCQSLSRFQKNICFKPLSKWDNNIIFQLFKETLLK